MVFMDLRFFKKCKLMLMCVVVLCKQIIESVKTRNPHASKNLFPILSSFVVVGQVEDS